MCHEYEYWMRGTTKQEKALCADTSRLGSHSPSKKWRARTFDFVGVWDERIPKENLSWKGLTKFKEAFGGKTLYYPLLKWEKNQFAG